MEEWKEYKLGEVCNMIPGFAFKSKDFGIGKNIAIKIKDIRPPYVEIKEADNVDTSNYNIEKLSKFLVHKGEFLLAMTGATIGKIGRYICENPAYVNQRVLKFEDAGLILYDYLYYYLSTDVFQSFITNHIDSQSAQPNISSTTIGKYPIKVPSIKEQKRIASILKSLDDKIEVNRKINENLEQQAQALFKSWLKKCEDEVTIGDLSLNITDYTKCEQKQVVLINSSDVTEGRFEHHNLSENKNLKGHFKKRFQKGDILYSQVRPRNRHWGYCTFNADNYLASTQLMVIRNRSDVISSILLYQYIIENKVWMDFTLRTETRSGTFPQGNYEDLSAIKVPFGADVKEITDNLENIYSLIYKNEDESRRLAELRDALLPKLMSGELKVGDVLL